MFRSSARKLCFLAHPARKLAPIRNIGSSNLNERIGDFGSHVFRGSVAAPFLKQQNLPPNTMESRDWVRDGRADKVAAAILSWALTHNASTYCHWFQPLGSALLRHGQTGQVQNCVFQFDSKGRVETSFREKTLLRGETDGSSFPNGGLRATHTAAAYSALDPTSPVFIRGDTIFIPSGLVSFTGLALDEKTPLLRALDALSDQGTRLLRLLGYDVSSVFANIGLEQEFFFVPRDQYLGRPDLQFTGRTVVGRPPARGQELCDHYMAPISASSPALACMQDIQDQCFKLGIPLKTRHREVAPNQYEFAPLYGYATTQIDQNLVVMQIMEETAVKHGLAVLLHEKPFHGVNGSGKHNNWSLGTSDGVNLFDADQVTRHTGNVTIFPLMMAAVVSAVDKYGDLMRLASACPGNDFRLGACEAPPSIMSIYLGQDITDFLQNFIDGKSSKYVPNTKLLDIGTSILAPIVAPAEDRNRTSPFAFGGHRFEFRAVGSSQNVSMVNTVLATITAKSFKDFADAIEAGAKPQDVAAAALSKSWKAIFNGNGYDTKNQEALTAAGLWRFDSGVDAIHRYTVEKNVALFSELKVLSSEECSARQQVSLTQYSGIVEMEALVMVDLIQQHIIPSAKAAGLSSHVAQLEADLKTLRASLDGLHAETDTSAKAHKARTLRLEDMMAVRKSCDTVEALVPEALWTIPTYKDLVFLDQNTK